ncbi:hypothetical protein [Pseudomonas huanghezhanensis]|uniref:hypothetical protein n=1 Tax=Pseudomonas huanghezhanensis TaxID=3002903 RepID=UPI0022855FE1|nr:hypothetical protein [Pseudomonas sp. BSw22131]
MSDELGFRVLKCYIYKFIKNRVEKRPRFDVGIMGFTSKKYFWFKTARPLFGDYHAICELISLDALKREGFLSGEKKVYFMPQYTQGVSRGKRKSNVYCSTGIDVVGYLSSMNINDLQNITIFSSRFTWAVDLYEDTLPRTENDMDILIYIKRP